MNVCMIQLRNARVTRMLVSVLIGSIFFWHLFLFAPHSDGESRPFTLTDPGMIELFALGVVGGLILQSWWSLVTLPIGATVPWVVWMIVGGIVMARHGELTMPLVDVVLVSILFPFAFLVGLGIPMSMGVAVGVSVRRTVALAVGKPR